MTQFSLTKSLNLNNLVVTEKCLLPCLKISSGGIGDASPPERSVQFNLNGKLQGSENFIFNDNNTNSNSLMLTSPVVIPSYLVTNGSGRFLLKNTYTTVLSNVLVTENQTHVVNAPDTLWDKSGNGYYQIGGFSNAMSGHPNGPLYAFRIQGYESLNHSDVRIRFFGNMPHVNNATPSQPQQNITTIGAIPTFTPGVGTPLLEDSAYANYNLGQVVQALINYGLLDGIPNTPP